MNFNNKVVLITGASTGIGKAIAQKLMNENCKLVLLSRRTELIEEYLNQAQLTNNKPLILKCDVSKKEEIVSAYKQIKEKFGKVDIAILNAGIGHHVTVENYNSQFAEETFGTNIFGIVYWVEQLLPEFVKRREGIIVGVSSLADNRGYSGSGFYCASKAAASIYLEGLRVELKPYGIKVITIKPGFVKTPMTDKNEFKMPLLMPAEKAAHIIIDGIKKEKRVIQFPWQMVLISRLVGLLPGSLYEWLAMKTKT
ncbi:MAG: SDR family NAD(P)-dependent oxidoreductase [Ignavibacteriales bacterium]|nr:MAG: SDR family NAD(P)-dependent oxidoreductase [Ignavibacteriales bacterium]